MLKIEVVYDPHDGRITVCGVVPTVVTKSVAEAVEAVENTLRDHIDNPRQ